MGEQAVKNVGHYPGVANRAELSSDQLQHCVVCVIAIERDAVADQPQHGAEALYRLTGLVDCGSLGFRCGVNYGEGDIELGLDDPIESLAKGFSSTEVQGTGAIGGCGVRCCSHGTGG